MKEEEKEYHPHGSFLVFEAEQKYLFLQREDNGLFELPGGGFNSKETDHPKVLLREVQEEAGLLLTKEMLTFCGILGQRLKKDTIEYYDGKIEVGFTFIHSASTTKAIEDIKIRLSKEHTDHIWCSYDEVITNWENFSSGPLWMWFTYLTFRETGVVQQGKLFERRIWKGTEYFKAA